MPRPAKSPGSGRVRLRKKGRYWYARFTADDATRPEVPLRVSNKVTAEDKARQINDALEKGEPWEWVVGRTRAGERTFRDLVAEYLDRGTRWSDATKAGNSGTVNLLLEEFGDTPLSRLDRRAVEGYLARRRAEGLATATRNRYLCALKVILGKGREWGYLRESPAADLKQEPEGRKLPRPYRDAEVATLLSCLSEHPRQVTEVYLHTALRMGELVKLLWADVDLVGRTLTVRAPKNHRDRTIPLSGRVVEILAERRREWDLECRRGIADPRVYGERANIRKAIRRGWGEIPAERRAVLRPIHSFRDTAITHLVSEGVPLPVVQELAGHATIEMTRRYAEVSPEAVRQAVERVFG